MALVYNCYRCRRTIKPTETPMVWRDEIVCAECHAALNAPQPTTPAPTKAPAIPAVRVRTPRQVSIITFYSAISCVVFAGILVAVLLYLHFTDRTNELRDQLKAQATRTAELQDQLSSQSKSLRTLGRTLDAQGSLLESVAELARNANRYAHSHGR